MHRSKLLDHYHQRRRLEARPYAQSPADSDGRVDMTRGRSCQQ
jgi:hypothetical protein